MIDFVDVQVEGTLVVREHQALAWVPPGKMSDYAMPPSDRAYAETLVRGADGVTNGET